MPRSDRLFDLIQILRDGRLHRAQDIADRLNVSLRTVYRDMDRLIAAGVPIEGARGFGYMASAAITLPPLNLSLAELEALHQGLAMVAGSQDADLQQAALQLSAKIDAVLPDDRQAAGVGLVLSPFADAARGFAQMPALRAAIRARQKLELTFDGAVMVLRPLQLDYWGRVWTLVGWNETEHDFSALQVDRIISLRVLPQLFIDEPSKALSDYAGVGQKF
jgi:predicted DNA-binding transcriptional regulator YafY